MQDLWLNDQMMQGRYDIYLGVGSQQTTKLGCKTSGYQTEPGFIVEILHHLRVLQKHNGLD